jgi:hypothetical protein
MLAEGTPKASALKEQEFSTHQVQGSTGTDGKQLNPTQATTLPDGGDKVIFTEGNFCVLYRYR